MRYFWHGDKTNKRTTNRVKLGQVRLWNSMKIWLLQFICFLPVCTGHTNCGRMERAEASDREWEKAEEDKDEGRMAQGQGENGVRLWRKEHYCRANSVHADWMPAGSPKWQCLVLVALYRRHCWCAVHQGWKKNGEVWGCFWGELTARSCSIVLDHWLPSLTQALLTFCTIVVNFCCAKYMSH